MRISIDIDDRLLQNAMRVSASSTEKATIEAALRLLVKTHGQTAIRRLKGRVRWKGNLAKSREGRIDE